jgi:hypothetical protein
MDILKLIGYFLERSERSYPRIFWFCTLLGALLFNESVQTFSQSQRTQTLTLIERKPYINTKMDILKLIGYFLERSERSYPRIFWFCTLLGALLFNESVQTFSQSQRTQTLTLIERNTASVLAINSGGGQSGSFVLQTGLGKRKKFNIVFHRRLEQYFPDWKERMDYQKKQEEYYKLAMKRRKELKTLRLLDKKYYYTKEELDAMDYFHGTGFYQQYQDPEFKPNIFDTRQTFLLKMHDPVLRNNFLNSFNSKDY